MTPDFQKSAQTLALIERLREAPIGSVVTYAALSEAIGEDITETRGHLYSAIKALGSDGIAFGTVRGQGVKRLTADEIPAIGEAAILHIRRASRRARKRMAVVNTMNDAPNEVRIKINATSSLLGAIEHFSTGKSAAKAEKAATDGVVPPMKLLEALKG